MNNKEFILMTLGNFARMFRRLFGRRWYQLPGDRWVIYEGELSNNELREIGFIVDDFRR